MLIGISGKIGSGKDTVGKIFQCLHYLDKNNITNLSVLDLLEDNNLDLNLSGVTIKKFADKLKDIVCLLISCTREQLEDATFKNTELGEEWWYYKVPTGIRSKDFILLPRGHYKNEEDNIICENRFLVKLTPRLLLQLLGTDCGRNLIHPNIWGNALMSEYFPHVTGKLPVDEIEIYPNWIITDMRFPNEMQAVKDRGGITLRVERNVDIQGKPIRRENEHESETALDEAGFDYIIDNGHSINALIELVKEFREKCYEKITLFNR